MQHNGDHTTLVRYREGADGWRDRTRIFLSPVAAPSILGLFGFAGATFMVGAHLANWYGTPKSGIYLFPFAAMFGGVAQFLAGMWAYRARDGLATAMHGMWGSFWLAYGLLNLLAAVGAIVLPATGAFPEFGYWFIVLAVITFLGFAAAMAESIGLASVLFTLSIGSALFAIFNLTGTGGWDSVAGWFFMVSAWLATYTAGAMMLEGAYGRTILPLGKYTREANVPGGRFTIPMQHEHGMPGVKVGQ